MFIQPKVKTLQQPPGFFAGRGCLPEGQDNLKKNYSFEKQKRETDKKKKKEAKLEKRQNRDSGEPQPEKTDDEKTEE